MKTLITIVATLAIFGMLSPLLAVSTAVSSDGLRVWPEIAKTEYRMCEEITLFIGVTNVTDDTVEVPYLEESSIQNLSMTLVHSDGLRDRYRGVGDFTPRNPMLLAPGDTLMFPIILLDCFGGGGSHDDLPLCISPGDYSIEITYGGKYKFEISKLRILDTHSADSAKIQQFNQVITSRSSFRERAQMYGELYDALDSTPLQTRVATFYLMELTRDGEHPTVNLPMIKKIMHDYPSSGHMRWGFVALTRYFGDEQLKKAIREDPQLVGNRLSRNLLKLALYGIGKTDLYREVIK